MLKFILAVCTLFVTDLAQADEHACSELFYSRPFYNNRELVNNRPTVKILGVARNERGEAYFRYRKLLEEQARYSYYGKHSFEPQGDPFRIIGIIGYELARLVGFSWNAKGDVFAPVADTMNARLAAFNKFLISEGVEPIPVTFYSQQRATIESYLRFWSLYLGIPVAEGESTHTLHDVSFHYAGILLPPTVVRLIQVQATAGYTLWTIQGANKTTARRSPAQLISSMMDALSTSANLNQIPRVERAGLLERSIYYNFATKIDESKSEGVRRSPHPASRYSLLDYLEEYLYMSRYPEAYTDLRNTFEDLDEVRQKIRERRRKGDADDLILRKLSQDQPALSKTAAEWGFTSTDDILNLFEARQTELQNAAGRFLKLHPVANSSTL